VRDPELRSPELTGHWEAKLKQIEDGRLDARRFKQDVTSYVQRLIAPEPPLDETTWGACPRCGKSVIEGRRGWGCSGWRDGCGFVLWREHKGHELSPTEARELLQRRRLSEPVEIEDDESGAARKILCLTSQGGVVEVEPPQPNARRRTSTASDQPEDAPKGAKSRRTKAPRRAPKKSKRASASKAKSAARRKAPSRRATSSDSTAALGACPNCGAEVLEQAKSYGCSAWRDGCKFAIWKTIAGKEITRRAAETLLRSGKTSLLKGFVSRAGKPFDARLKIEDGEVRFDFGDDE
jgi:DNA topoisomerase-3